MVETKQEDDLLLDYYRRVEQELALRITAAIPESQEAALVSVFEKAKDKLPRALVLKEGGAGPVLLYQFSEYDFYCGQSKQFFDGFSREYSYPPITSVCRTRLFPNPQRFVEVLKKELALAKGPEVVLPAGWHVFTYQIDKPDPEPQENNQHPDWEFEDRTFIIQATSVQEAVEKLKQDLDQKKNKDRYFKDFKIAIDGKWRELEYTDSERGWWVDWKLLIITDFFLPDPVLPAQPQESESQSTITKEVTE